MPLAFERLLRLYPASVRDMYGTEMAASFAFGLDARRRSRARRIGYAIREVVLLLCDAAAERAASLYSHRSFHGRQRPDLGVVRPPNMGKQEWFGKV